MPVVYVIYEPHDRSFVEDQLIRPLPALGFDRWLSSGMLQQGPTGAPSIPLAIIDDGIDVLHEAFLDADGQSRIVGIWDQQDNDKPASPPIAAAGI